MIPLKWIAACLTAPLLAAAFFLSGYLVHSTPTVKPDYKGTALAQITSAAIANGIVLSEEKYLGTKLAPNGVASSWVRVRVGTADPILLRVVMLKQFVWVARVCKENTGISSPNDCGTTNVRP